MKLNYHRIAALPALIRTFCYSHEGWIVGSAATYLLDFDNPTPPRDFDILIPFYTWGLACRCIPEGTPTNSFGGLKVVSDGCTIDVWAGDIGWFLAQVPKVPAYAVHPKSFSFLTVDRGCEKK